MIFGVLQLAKNNTPNSNSILLLTTPKIYDRLIDSIFMHVFFGGKMNRNLDFQKISIVNLKNVFYLRYMKFGKVLVSCFEAIIFFPFVSAVSVAARRIYTSPIAFPIL
jgi:hypothetical protein